MSGVLGSAVAAALKSVGSALPELSRTMTADGKSAKVILASSVDRGLDAASSSGANETHRLVAKVADFPDLTLESLVEVDSVPHLITSLRESGVAAWFVGLSAEMATTEARVSGSRRERSAVRGIDTSVPALVCRAAADTSTPDGIFAHPEADTYFIVIRFADWGEVTEPDTGDALAFMHDGREIAAVVSKADRHAGYFLLTARSR